jgi:tRNA U34 5-methylaminomethyl-2-thiouridine-forming methyltransferase MnmC
MKKFITKDGSTTYYNNEVGDHYHTKAGAKEEAFEKHAKALEINSVKNPAIFDICFGLGYSSAAALDLLKKVTIYCFENDKKILRKILLLNEDFKSFPIIKEFVRNYLEEGKTVYKKEGIKLIMVFGDVREEIKKIKEKADFVFFAPFSPEKVPDMWTAEFFSDIRNKMKTNGKLSTYAYARMVKENLKKSGFELKDGPTLNRRSPSLIAINQNV